MLQAILYKFLSSKNIIYNNTTRVILGRWNTKDNKDIKATLANMDCCGDNLCGDPLNYSKNIEKILKANNKN